MNGIWTCTAATVDGKPLPEATVKLLRLTLSADRYKTEKGDETLFDSRYTLDTTQNPPHIDIVGTESPMAEQRALGICSQEGDTLKMCYTMPGLPRPTEFESTVGSGAYLITWRRRGSQG